MDGFQPAEDVTSIMQIDVSENVCWKKIVKAWQKSCWQLRNQDYLGSVPSHGVYLVFLQKLSTCQETFAYFIVNFANVLLEVGVWSGFQLSKWTPMSTGKMQTLMEMKM